MLVVNLNKFYSYRKNTFYNKNEKIINIFNNSNKQSFSFNENINEKLKNAKKLKLNNLPFLNNQKSVFKNLHYKNIFNYKNKFKDLINTTNNFNNFNDKKKVGEILFKNSFSTKNIISNKIKLNLENNEQKNFIFNNRKFDKFYTKKLDNNKKLKTIKFNNSETNILNQNEKKNLFKILLDKKIININKLIKKSINDLKLSKNKIYNEYLIANNIIKNEEFL